MARVGSGDIVGGRYRLECQIGEGGMATVWRATDLTLERPVALKFLFAADEREREAIADEFLREAKLAASVRHRNVVQILDFGRHADGIPFMVMELLEGDSLGDRFDRGEMFDLQFIVELLADALQGLAAVHDAGIVHRDLKPENIFLVEEREGVYPKLLDFGISKSIDPRSGKRSAVTTHDGRVIGTPEYMSPEQARGLPDVDRRTDIYSMGVVIYEALAGHAPFESQNTGDLMVLVIHGQATALADLVPELGSAISKVVAKAMHREPEQRYADASSMRKALLEALEQTLPNYRARRGAPPPMRSRHRAARPADKRLSDAIVEAVVPLARAGSPLPPRPSRGAWALMAGGLALVVVGGVLLLRSGASSEPTPRFIVVRGSEEPAGMEVAAAPQPAAPVPSLPSQSVAAAEPAAAPKAEPAAPPAARAKRDPADDAANQLARAFHRQKAPVVRCFDRFPGDLAEGATLSLRVALSPEGRVQEVTISPSGLASGPLADCIRKAVQAMRFGSQAKAMAFRVPLIARRASPPE